MKPVDLRYNTPYVYYSEQFNIMMVAIRRLNGPNYDNGHTDRYDLDFGAEYKAGSFWIYPECLIRWNFKTGKYEQLEFKLIGEL